MAEDPLQIVPLLVASLLASKSPQGNPITIRDTPPGFESNPIAFRDSSL